MSIPERIGRYGVVELLGSGAMGEVYKATDPKMHDRHVAMKILSGRLSKNEIAHRRFKLEVEQLARLDHPNIVKIFDRGEHEGRPYFVMEFLDGFDLNLMTSGAETRTLSEKVELARQITEALDYAHSRGLVHRDIKPGNIMIIRPGNEDQAKLVDFGIVHQERSNLTQASTQPGTFSYMSPEALVGAEIDNRSDLFSLGIVLYELFTLEHPFQAATDPIVIDKIRREEPSRPRQKNAEIPSALDAIILKLLEKDPVHRPPRAQEVAEALRRIGINQQSKSLGTDPSDYEDLGDLNRQIARKYLEYARIKESDGDLEEALKAYEKVFQVSPENAKLQRKIPQLRHKIESTRELKHLLEEAGRLLEEGEVVSSREVWRKAWILSPNDEKVQALEIRLETVEAQNGGDPDRARSIKVELAAADHMMEAGNFTEARHHLVQLIQRYPDEALVQLMLNRIVDIQASGIDYVTYSGHLKTAHDHLDSDRFAEAHASCQDAKKLWASDEEWFDLDRKVSARVESEIARVITAAEHLLKTAEEGSAKDHERLAAIREVTGLRDRAEELGAADQWTGPARKTTTRLRQDVAARIEAVSASRWMMDLRRVSGCSRKPTTWPTRMRSISEL